MWFQNRTFKVSNSCVISSFSLIGEEEVNCMYEVPTQHNGQIRNVTVVHSFLQTTVTLQFSVATCKAGLL